MALEKLGIPQVTVVSQQFVTLARMVAANLGMPDLRMVVVPHGLETASDREISDVASKYAPEVADSLVRRSPPRAT